MTYILIAIIGLFILGIFVMAKLHATLPIGFRPFFKSINTWMENLTYNQVLWAASFLITLANSNMLKNASGPIAVVRDLVKSLGSMAYNIAGIWQTHTLEEKK